MSGSAAGRSPWRHLTSAGWFAPVASLLFFLLVGLIVVAPSLGDLSEQALGTEQSNALKHVWGQWWGMEQIARHGYVPNRLDLLNFPEGGSFFSLEQGHQWIGLLLSPLFNAVAIYNLLLLIHLALAGWAAFLLARELTRSWWPSLIAGIAYGFSPFVLSFSVLSGVAETAILFPLPLALLFALRTVTSRSWWNPLLGGFFFALQGLGCWSHGISAALMLVVLLAARLRACRRSTPAARPSEEGAIFAADGCDLFLVARILIFLLVPLLLAAPIYLAMEGAMRGSEAVYHRPVRLLPEEFGLPETTQHLFLAQYLLPGHWGLRVERHIDELFYASYIGYALLLPALAGVALRRRGAALMGATAFFFAILSLGMRAGFLEGSTVAEVANYPYALLYNLFPLFNNTANSPDRFAVPVQLALGLAAAGGLCWLSERCPSRTWLIGVGAALLLLLEYLLAGPVPWPLPTTPARPSELASALADQPDGALLDLPAQFPGTNLAVGDIFFQQTIHGRPIPYNLLGLSPTVAANPLFQQLSASAPAAAPADCAGAAQLRELGFGFIALHQSRLEPANAAAAEELLTHCLGLPTRLQQVLLFQLQPSPTPATLPAPINHPPSTTPNGRGAP